MILTRLFCFLLPPSCVIPASDPYYQLPPPFFLLPAPRSLLPAPCSQFCLFPAPCFLFPVLPFACSLPNSILQLNSQLCDTERLLPYPANSEEKYSQQHVPKRNRWAPFSRCNFVKRYVSLAQSQKHICFCTFPMGSKQKILSYCCEKWIYLRLV